MEKLDIGLLYQEYQLAAQRRSAEHQQDATGHQQRQRQGLQQQQPHQQHHQHHHYQSSAQSGLLNSIRNVMPHLLAPSPPSSRSPATLPPSGSPEQLSSPSLDDAGKLVVDLSEPRAERKASHSWRRRVSSEAPRRSPERGQSSAAAAAASAAAAAPAGSKRQQRTVTMDIGSGRTRKEQRHHQQQLPLVVIDPKEVKNVLSQVMTRAVRDLLTKDQDTQGRSLLRQIRRTLSDFETSITGIVNNLCFASKRHLADKRICPINNSADATGGASAYSSHESGHTIRESCCPSDECTDSGQLQLVDSDSAGVPPLSYRPLGNLGCPDCAALGDAHQQSRSNRRRSRSRYCQNNFNHASNNCSSSENFSPAAEPQNTASASCCGRATRKAQDTTRPMFPRFSADSSSSRRPTRDPRRLDQGQCQCGCPFY